MLAMLACAPTRALAQQVIGQAQETIRIDRGSSALLQLPRNAERMSLGDPNVADTQLTAPNEIIILGVAVGTTNLFIWTIDGAVLSYAIEVTPDVGPLREQIQTIFPEANITVTASGNAVILTGAVRDPAVVRRVLQLAEATGAEIINNIQAPTAEQILLHVRFAEIDRSALSRLGVDLFVSNAGGLEQVVESDSRTDFETLSEGIVRLFLTGRDAQLDAVIRALRSSGEFRSLAEPNLLAIEGEEATFLAGGEFPYPTVQSGVGSVGGQAAISITFKEFGVRLSFTPTVTPSGTIRLRVAPEVSSLDFSAGLTISGFAVPSLLTRRTETTVELAPGQHLAIAGLLDNRMTEQVDKIPLLGDLPVLGALFRSREHRQERTELLVLVTPHIVEPSDQPIPVPPGEPDTWRWNSRMRPDTINRTLPQVRRDGGSQ